VALEVALFQVVAVLGPGLGVEVLGAQEVEGRAVELVGAALGHHVDDGAARAAVLGRRVGRHDAELGGGIHVDVHGVADGLRVVVVDAVDLVVVAALAAAVGGRIAGLALDHAGGQIDQAQRVAAVERQVGDALLVNDGVELGGGGFHLLDLGADLDFGGHFGNGHDHGEVQVFTDGQLDAGDSDRLEALEFGLDFVVADSEVCENVESVVVRQRLAGGASVRVGQDHGDAGDDAAGVVLDHTFDALGHRAHSQKGQEQREDQEPG